MIQTKVVAALAMLATAPVFASPFDGTWKADPSTLEAASKPNVFAVKDGMYSCSTCVPAYKIKADGAFHATPGNPYRDEVSVKVVDPRTIMLATRKGGKTMFTQTETAAADGKTMEVSFNDTSAPGGIAVAGKQVLRRAAAGPAGSHATSGAWLETKDLTVADAGMTSTFRSEGKAMTFTTPTGVKYTAILGGPVAPVTGDVGWDGVTLASKGADTLVETDYRDGKKIGINTMKVAADGRSVRSASQDLVHGTSQAITLVKQ